MWISVLEPLETGDLQPAPRFLLALRLRHVTPRDLHRQDDVLQRGSPRQQQRTLEHVAHLPLNFTLIDRPAIEQDTALARLQHAGEDLEQRGLTATGRADDTQERTGGDLERHVRQRRPRSVARLEDAREVFDRDSGGATHSLSSALRIAPALCAIWAAIL